MKTWLLIPVCIFMLTACGDGRSSEGGFYVGGAGGADRAEPAR